jgi:hypothetical protein
VSWFNKIAKIAFLGDSNTRAVLSKMQGHCQRIALLLHCLDAAVKDGNTMTLLSAGTMERAVLLSDWLVEHQRQVWRYFAPEGPAEAVTPIQKAIMSVCVDEESNIIRDGGRIASVRLHALVEDVLNLPGIKKTDVGKSASALGFGKGWLSGKKARTVDTTQLEKFKKVVKPVVLVV